MGIRDFFRKSKREDITVDLADLQRKGIYKPRKEIIRISKSDSFIDLTSSGSKSSSAENPSPLGFLGSLASANSSNETSEITERSSDSAIFVSGQQKQKLRGILRDLKGKIDSTYNKLYKITERIDLLEKKIERLERKAGVSG